MKNIESIKQNSGLTPKQKEIEILALNHAFTHSESTEMLKLLSSMNENLKSTIHYHSSSYITYLIESADNFIESIK